MGFAPNRPLGCPITRYKTRRFLSKLKFKGIRIIKVKKY
jgi:hypothetical protein